MPGTLYRVLHEHAVEQHGFVTTRDAEELEDVDRQWAALVVVPEDVVHPGLLGG